MNAAPRGACPPAHGREGGSRGKSGSARGTGAAHREGMMHALWMTLPAALAVSLFVATLRLQGSR